MLKTNTMIIQIEFKLYDSTLIDYIQLQENNSNVEIVQLDYDEMYGSKHQYQNKNNNHEEPRQTNEFQTKNIIEEESTKDNSYHANATYENSYYDNDNDYKNDIKAESTHAEEMKMNRENQW